MPRSRLQWIAPSLGLPCSRCRAPSYTASAGDLVVAQPGTGSGAVQLRPSRLVVTMIRWAASA